ncbi:MAG: hypothetical protein ABJE95_27505 [Byssovorax sp.]
MKAADPSVVATPEQLIWARSVVIFAERESVITLSQRVALEAILVKGVALARAGEVVGALYVAAPHESEIRFHAFDYLRGTPPTRGGVLADLDRDEARKTAVAELVRLAIAEETDLDGRHRIAEEGAQIANADLGTLLPDRLYRFVHWLHLNALPGGELEVKAGAWLDADENGGRS